jgi:hypothetical protein
LTRRCLNLLLEDGDELRTATVTDAAGIRYLELTRVDGKP